MSRPDLALGSSYVEYEPDDDDTDEPEEYPDTDCEYWATCRIKDCEDCFTTRG